MQSPHVSEPETMTEQGGRQVHVFALPVEEPFLHRFLEDVYTNHWQGIVFGPILPGAAFEFRCPSAPKTISLLDGYLTVHFGGTHFHLCIGPTQTAEPTEARRRQPSRAELFRGLDKDGAPNTWGFRLFNGEGLPTFTLFFPNPFLTDEDRIAENPDWSRLAVWEDVSQRYLGRAPDPFDRTGKGFR